ncbi:MAG: MCE family protein [Saprospirales bacterium]|nr:MCE family protein [Saprospirales bacterium]
MQIRRETKIGLLTAGALALLIWGYEFLKGRNILQSSQIFISEYDNVDELKKSNPIQVNGLQVGIVRAVYLNPQNLTSIIVEMDVSKDIKVPLGTVAEIHTSSLMGGRIIELVFPAECIDGSCPPAGKVLEGRTLGFLNSMVGTDNLDTYLTILETRLTRLTDTIISRFSDNPELQKSGKDLQSILANLNSASATLTRQLNGSLGDSFDNIASVTENLKKNNEQISKMIDNLASVSGDLKEEDVVGNVNTTVTQLKSTLQQIDGAVADLTSVLSRIQEGQGTLGLLVKDREMYDQLNKTLTNIDLLTQDIRLNPKRYTTVLSKKSKPYEKPEDDPAAILGGSN